MDHLFLDKDHFLYHDRPPRCGLSRARQPDCREGHANPEGDWHGRGPAIQPTPTHQGLCSLSQPLAQRPELLAPPSRLLKKESSAPGRGPGQGSPVPFTACPGLFYQQSSHAFCITSQEPFGSPASRASTAKDHRSPLINARQWVLPGASTFSTLSLPASPTPRRPTEPGCQHHPSPGTTCLVRVAETALPQGAIPLS